MVKCRRYEVKSCPLCGGKMHVDLDIQDDEILYGDETNGDFELGQSAAIVRECETCGNYEVVENLGFKGSGILR